MSSSDLVSLPRWSGLGKNDIAKRSTELKSVFVPLGFTEGTVFVILAFAMKFEKYQLQS